MARRTHVRIPVAGRALSPVGSDFVSVEVLGRRAAARRDGERVDLGERRARVVRRAVGAQPDDRARRSRGHRERAANGSTRARWPCSSSSSASRSSESSSAASSGTDVPRACRCLAALGGMVVPGAPLPRAATRGGAGQPGLGDPDGDRHRVRRRGAGGTRTSASRKPLKLFLLTLAIVDDIGAVVVIALFYSHGVALGWLAGAVGVVARDPRAATTRRRAPILYVDPRRRTVGVPAGVGRARRDGRRRAGPAHAGAAVRRARGDRARSKRVSTCGRACSSFHCSRSPTPASSSTSAAVHRALESRIAWGIVLGLVDRQAARHHAGERAGGAHAASAGFRTGSPCGGLLGVGMVAGIGFTVSLFVAGLSFTAARLDDAKFAILAASLVSATRGRVVDSVDQRSRVRATKPTPPVRRRPTAARARRTRASRRGTRVRRGRRKSISTHDASRRPSIARGFSPVCSKIWRSTSSTIVRTSREFGALVITKHSTIPMMSATSRTRMSSPFLSSAARAAIRALVVTSAAVTAVSTRARAPRVIPAPLIELVTHVPAAPPSPPVCHGLPVPEPTGAVVEVGHGRGRFAFPGPVRTEQPRDHAGRERQEEHHDLRRAGRAGGGDRRRGGSSPVEPVGMQDPRGRDRHEELDRLSRRDPAPQIGRRQLQTRHGDVYHAPARRIGRRLVVAVDDRERHELAEVVDAVPASADRRRRRSRQRGTARVPATRALRPCRRVRRARRGRARSATPRSPRLRRSPRRPSRSEPRRARSLGHASATDRAATTISTRSSPSWWRAAAASMRWPTCTGSNVPPRIPMRSTRSSATEERCVKRRVAAARVLPRSRTLARMTTTRDSPRATIAFVWSCASGCPTARVRSDSSRRASARSAPTSSASTCSNAASTSRSTSSRSSSRASSS